MKPDKVQDSVGKLVEDYWKPSLKILSDVKFLDSLINFDKDNIPDKVIDKIRSVYLTNVNFDPDKVKTASTACEGLCRWVYAISEYDKVAKVVAPKKVALARAEALYNDAVMKLEVKRAQLAEIQVNFQKKYKFSSLKVKKSFLPKKKKLHKHSTMNFTACPSFVCNAIGKIGCPRGYSEREKNRLSSHDG